MNIVCTSKPQLPSAGAVVNQLGRYMYKHLDGAYKFEKYINMFDVYTVVIYSIPSEIVKLYKLYADANEMELDINITTYANKIRVNITEITPEEKTIGHDTYPLELFTNMNNAYEIVYAKICKRIAKEFADFDFLF